MRWGSYKAQWDISRIWPLKNTSKMAKNGSVKNPKKVDGGNLRVPQSVLTIRLFFCKKYKAGYPEICEINNLSDWSDIWHWTFWHLTIDIQAEVALRTPHLIWAIYKRRLITVLGVTWTFFAYQYFEICSDKIHSMNTFFKQVITHQGEWLIGRLRVKYFACD